jgi:hypothetical protein
MTTHLTNRSVSLFRISSNCWTPWPPQRCHMPHMELGCSARQVLARRHYANAYIGAHMRTCTHMCIHTPGLVTSQPNLHACNDRGTHRCTSWKGRPWRRSWPAWRLSEHRRPTPSGDLAERRNRAASFHCSEVSMPRVQHTSMPSCECSAR